MRLNAGQLKDLITIQSPPTTRDSHGQLSGSYTEFAQVWADVRAKNGSDFIQSEGEAAQVMYQIKIRHRSDLSADMRILYEGRTLEITAPPYDPDGFSEQTMILAREVT